MYVFIFLFLIELCLYNETLRDLLEMLCIPYGIALMHDAYLILLFGRQIQRGAIKHAIVFLVSMLVDIRELKPIPNNVIRVMAIGVYYAYINYLFV